MYYSGSVHKISSQSVHNFLSNVVHRQTDRQTDKLTNATKNITSFAKEVINSSSIIHNVLFVHDHDSVSDIVVLGLCTKMDKISTNIESDVTQMFWWKDSEAVAEYMSAKLEIGVSDVLFCVNYEEDDKTNSEQNIMGKAC